MSKNKGFTLIETIIVLAIIGIILAVTYPSLSGAYDMSNENDRAKQEYVVNKALIEYYALTGTYPIQSDVNWTSEFAQQTGVSLMNTTKYNYTYTTNVNNEIIAISVQLIKKDTLW